MIGGKGLNSPKDHHWLCLPAPPTTTKLSMLVRARPMNSEVATVTVGIPSFSTSSWSPTSHEVQLPQSHWEPITISGLYLAMICAFWAATSMLALWGTVVGSTS